MKAKTFENLIRKVVREEIDYALRREIKTLKEDLRNEISSPIVEQYEESPALKTPKNNLKRQIMGSEPMKTKPFVKRNFTSNSALNDLLNETAQGDTRLNGNVSPVSMEGDFNTIGDMPVEAAPKEVADAVTRDYSSLMEAIDKRNQKNRP